MRIYVRLPLSVVLQDLITTGSFYISSDFAILNIVVANRYLTKTSQCLILALKIVNYLQKFLYYESSTRNYKNYKFPGVEILWEGIVSAELPVNRRKLCRNYAFPQNFHIRKLGEITVFYAVFCFSLEVEAPGFESVLQDFRHHILDIIFRLIFTPIVFYL